MLMFVSFSVTVTVYGYGSKGGSFPKNLTLAYKNFCRVKFGFNPTLFCAERCICAVGVVCYIANFSVQILFCSLTFAENLLNYIKK